ncbi:sigma-70 family RNA polymerase sigma factor [Cytobacillus gottheilii]|uniref:sigma-70 family RNA polymerase sigma factor n=1 Tax=Cytobacillus gottheilii TaxID=859144 RepID=UPI0009BADE86|nr:sigma-70 family RNA polymerase sigma factor [Cytobacillus gottheilii]
MESHEVITELMDSYGTSILQLAYSFVRNKQTAEDLTQEIFIKCYEKLDTFEGNSSMHTWLYRIAINHCKDHVKSWNYRKVHVSQHISKWFTSHQEGPESKMIHKSESEQLFNEILTLPPKYREIIFLYYFQELQLKEISDICQINLSTVKSRITRAKQLLKNAITERGAKDGQQTNEDERRSVKG